MKTDWLTYIIENQEGIYYTGVTNDMERRLKQHNGYLKGGARSTRRGRPWKIVVTSSFMTKSEAMSLEYAVKKQQKHLKVGYLVDNGKGR